MIEREWVTGKKPFVSVIMPVFNEAGCIRRVMDSVLAQDTSDFNLEVLVIDGRSTDETASIIAEIAAENQRVRLLDNPHRKTPFAFNIGLKEARGEYVCILGAHTIYPRNYIAVCLRELLRTGATGSSGRVKTVPRGDTISARMVAWCLDSRFASSTGSVRTQASGFVDTIPYPLMRKDALLALGGYDERLSRNQDNDMNERLRARGHRLYLTPLVTCTYCGPPNVSALFRYAYRSGRWNALTFTRKPKSISVRHLVPFAFVCGSILLATCSVLPAPTISSIAGDMLLIALGSHLLAGAVAAIHTTIRTRSLSAMLLPAVILGFHLAYGLGTLCGFLSMAAVSLTPVPRSLKSAE